MRKLFCVLLFSISTVCGISQSAMNVFSVNTTEIQKTVVNSKIYLVKIEKTKLDFIKNFSSQLLKIEGVLKAESSSIGASNSDEYYLNVEIRNGELDKNSLINLFHKYNVRDCLVDGQTKLISEVIL